jgi:branched-chain amino acid transport system substrate-binding protein
MKITLHKKTLSLFVIIFILFSGTSFLIYFTNKKDVQQTIYLAVAGPFDSGSSGGTSSTNEKGPLSGQGDVNGRDMLLGIELGIQAVRDQGKLENIIIKPIYYNEKGIKDALKNASEIADENKVLAVIGHYTNANTLTAGAIYRDNGIPAITASAANEDVTKDNNWYFKIMPDRRSTRVLIAHNVKNLLEQDTASIIFANNSYGRDLVKYFEKQAKETGLQIKHKWSFNNDPEELEHQIRGIVGKLRAVQDPGTIFCALFSGEADDLFTELRYPGTDFRIIGPNSFSSPLFIEQFNEYPKEKESPGYYTDGIYAVSPFIAYLADSPVAAEFRKKTIERSGTEPSWVTANYYDAALLIANAIERAEIKGQDIRKNRRKLKKALKSFDEPDNAIKGITGKLYFDQEQTVPRSLQLGVWRKHHFLPAYFQYRATGIKNDSKRVAREKKPASQGASKDKEDTEKTLIIDGQKLDRYRVVYAGVDINHISNLDVKQGLFTADFYLWFRYAGDFNDNDITFPNAVKPIVLGKPIIKKKTTDGAHLLVYKLHSDFMNDFSLYSYPLDRHKLRIHFHHQKENRNHLIYVPDIEALPFLSQKNDQGGSMIHNIPGWEVKDISYSQQISVNTPSVNNKGTYSVLSTEVEIQRHGRIFLLAKNFFPVVLIIIAWYFIFFHQNTRDLFRLHALLCASLFTLWFQMMYALSLPGQQVIKSILPVLYLAIGVGELTSGAIYLLHRYNKKTDQRERYLLYMGQALYCIVTLGGIFFVLNTVRPLLDS